MIPNLLANFKSRYANYAIQVLNWSIALFCISAIGYVWLINPLYVPDEIWFADLAKQIDKNYLLNPFAIKNYLGYGSFFWWLLAVVFYFANWLSIDGMWLFRLVNLLFIIIIYLTFYLIPNANSGNGRKSFFSLLIFTSPFLFFFGKIVAPEIVTVTILALAFFLYHPKNNFRIFFSLFLFGFASSIKINAIFIFPFYYLYFLFFNRQPIVWNNKYLVFILFFSVGFIVASPNILINFNEWFSILSKYLPSNRLTLTSLTKIKNTLLGFRFIDGNLVFNYTEDLIRIAGFFFVSVNIAFYTYLMIQFFKINRLIFYLILFTTMFYAFLFRNQPFEWYWFPYTLFFYRLVIEQLQFNTIYLTKFGWGLALASIIIIFNNFSWVNRLKFENDFVVKNISEFKADFKMYNSKYQVIVFPYFLANRLVDSKYAHDCYKKLVKWKINDFTDKNKGTILLGNVDYLKLLFRLDVNEISVKGYKFKVIKDYGNGYKIMMILN